METSNTHRTSTNNESRLKQNGLEASSVRPHGCPNGVKGLKLIRGNVFGNVPADTDGKRGDKYVAS
jgi:hypothetical protein